MLYSHDPSGIVIFAISRDTGQIGLPGHVEILAASIQKIMKLTAKAASYNIPPNSGDPDQVIVLIKGSATGQIPTVWVENQTVRVTEAQTSSIAASSRGSTE